LQLGCGRKQPQVLVARAPVGQVDGDDIPGFRTSDVPAELLDSSDKGIALPCRHWADWRGEPKNGDE
jgi:hypothetical protein